MSYGIYLVQSINKWLSQNRRLFLEPSLNEISMLGGSLARFLRIGMRESPSPATQHFCPLLHGHVDLVTHRDQTLRQVSVVFA